MLLLCIIMSQICSISVQLNANQYDQISDSTCAMVIVAVEGLHLRTRAYIVPYLYLKRRWNLLEKDEEL